MSPHVFAALASIPEGRRSDGEGIITGRKWPYGGELLRLLRLDARVTSIIAPSRKPLPVMNKLINPQGENIGELLKTLDQPVDLVFCCLGTTRKQAGSKGGISSGGLSVGIGRR